MNAAVINISGAAEAFAAHPLTPALGARIEGVDLAADMSDEVFRAIYQAFLAHQVLLFRRSRFRRRVRWRSRDASAKCRCM